MNILTQLGFDDLAGPVGDPPLIARVERRKSKMPVIAPLPQETFSSVLAKMKGDHPTGGSITHDDPSGVLYMTGE